MQTIQKEFIITRTFNAPKELVFKAFSESEALAQWWGPKEMPITVIKLDFRPHGIFHYKMEGNGSTGYGLFIYEEINRPDAFTFLSSFSDEQGNVCRAPFSEVWPLQIYNHLTLVENNGTTTLTLKGAPVNATEEEKNFYFSFTSNMEQGFKGTFDQLDNYLQTHQK
jgi:uncharacterized protein YndB with AHSA1/START domain